MRSTSLAPSCTDSQMSDLTKLLAIGVLRLRRRSALSGSNESNPPAKSRKFSPRGLEVSGETVLSVQSG